MSDAYDDFDAGPFKDSIWEKQVSKDQPECCDPTAPIEICCICGAPVYTCEITPPDGVWIVDYCCPAHPDGCELADGRWVCSLECWEIAVGP